MIGCAGGNGTGPRDALPAETPAPAAPPDTGPPVGAETAAGAVSGGPLRRVVRIVNPLGLHLRVADRFKRTAAQYACTVTVWNGELKADGASLWDLIGLMAVPDSELVLEIDGPDAHRAVGPLADVLGSPGGEDYTI